MDLIINFAYIVLALLIVIVSANKFITAASMVAQLLKVPSIIIGTLLVGFGNAAPELAISVFSALYGSTGLAIGNAFGSNLANTGLVLGTVSILAPVAIHSTLKRKELPWLFSSFALMALIAWSQEITRLEGIILLVLAVIYVLTSVKSGIKEFKENQDQNEKISKSAIALQIFITLAGLAVLSLGSKLFVYGASNIARIFEINEFIIGITIVAFGTSVPELFSSVIAVIRKEDDLAIGNLVGSNIYNLLGVAGIAATITPATIEPNFFSRDVLAAALPTAFLTVCYFTKKLTRFHGSILLTTYMAYTVFIIFYVTNR